MRPTPARLPDDLLAQACGALGVEREQLKSDPVRAVVQAALRAQMAPRSSGVRVHRAPTQYPQIRPGAIDSKRRAANDFDEE